jgi:hypothetical protein
VNFVNPTRAKILIVLFGLAMLYGSICSATCVAGVCPNLERYSESHDCDQTSHQHSHGQNDQGQHGPDCKQHAHPPDFALKGSGMAAFQDESATALHAAAAIASLSNPSPVTQDILQEFHRTPPGVSKNTLHEQVFVLRI